MTAPARGLPTLAPDFEFDPGQAALLVVDMQRVDADPDVGLGAYLAEDDPEVHAYLYGRIADMVVPNTRRLIEQFRTLGRPVVHLNNGSELDDYADYLPRRRSRVRQTGFIPRVGTPEHEILPDLAPVEGELVVLKRSTSPFNSTAIDQLLRNMAVQDLVVTGVATDACVGLTAQDAADRGFGVIIAEDATATYTPARHEAFLSVFAAVHGLVRSTADVLALLRPDPTPDHHPTPTGGASR